MPTVYVTVPPSATDRIVQELLEDRLAACVNQIPCTSTYRWDGSVEQDEEVILLVKTTDARYDDVVDEILEHHPYDVPAIERFDATDGTPEFVEWLHESVSA